MAKWFSKNNTPAITGGALSIEKLYGLVVLLCALVHTVYLAVFLASGLLLLVVYECVSVAVFLMLGFAVRRRMFAVTLSVLHIGVCGTFAVCTLMFGWSCGFEYVLLSMLLLEGLFMYRGRTTPNLLRTLELLLLLAVGLLCIGSTPPYANILAGWQRNLLYIVNLAVFTAGVISSVLLTERSSSVAVMVLEEKANYLQRLAETDPLTGLLNRRCMTARLEQAVEHCRQTGEVFCVVMCDIDNFKLINDTYGHASGDFVLKMLAETIAEYLGGNEAVCRWGGEEILLLLENTGLAQAREIIGGLRRAVETAPFVYCGRILSVTMTMGITQSWAGASVTELVEQADMLMYAGKRRGKNCVVPSR